MSPIFQDRISRRLIIWGAIFFIIACIFATQDRFVMNIGLQRRLISREDTPLIYWGTDSGILLVALVLIALGIYRGRKSR